MNSEAFLCIPFKYAIITAKINPNAVSLAVDFTVSSNSMKGDDDLVQIL